jgi:diguanylate cyclase (GGDEF)-like protein
MGAGIAIEVLLQAALAVLWLGWDGGFQYHILLLLPVLLFTAWPPRPVKWLAAGSVGALYLALYLSSWLRPRPELVADRLQMLLHVLNAAAALWILGLIASRHQRLVGQATQRVAVAGGAQAVAGVLNRQRISELAAQHLRRIGDADCVRPELCLLVGDIDQLEQTAERHGQDAADQVQGAVGAALLQGMRQGDLVGRWGDEGFLIVLPGSDGGTGRMVGERLLALVRALEIRAGADGALLSPSISLGLCPVAAGEGLEQAIARAERALRLIQVAGRSHIGLAAPDN